MIEVCHTDSHDVSVSFSIQADCRRVVLEIDSTLYLHTQIYPVRPVREQALLFTRTKHHALVTNCKKAIVKATGFLEEHKVIVRRSKHPLPGIIRLLWLEDI